MGGRLAACVCRGRRITHSLFWSPRSFHSALKRQLKADKKAKEKEIKAASETPSTAEVCSTRCSVDILTDREGVWLCCPFTLYFVS